MSNYSIPTYKKIALDLANKIKEDIIKEGELLHGRSTLASTYNVSPETIRRAIILLEDLEVVKTLKGKGIIVLSKDRSELFLNRNKSIDNVKKLKSQINSLFNKRLELENQLSEAINGVIDYTSRFQEVTEIIPYEFEVSEECPYINRTFADINFWQNTGGTLVAIKRNGTLLLSPGPYVAILPKDILIVVGDESVLASVPDFLEL